MIEKICTWPNSHRTRRNRKSFDFLIWHQWVTASVGGKKKLKFPFPRGLHTVGRSRVDSANRHRDRWKIQIDLRPEIVSLSESCNELKKEVPKTEKTEKKSCSQRRRFGSVYNYLSIFWYWKWKCKLLRLCLRNEVKAIFKLSRRREEREVNVQCLKWNREKNIKFRRVREILCYFFDKGLPAAMVPLTGKNRRELKKEISLQSIWCVIWVSSAFFPFCRMFHNDSSIDFPWKKNFWSRLNSFRICIFWGQAYSCSLLAVISWLFRWDN